MGEMQPLQYDDIQIDVPWGCVSGRWYGNRQVRPILALHGWQDNLGTWDRLIPLLPRHVGVLCIDFPGHGRSSKYPKGVTYHVLDYVHIIIRIIKEYNWRKVSLLGHSMGGIVSFIYASLYPHTVDMLIQIDIIMPSNRRSVDTSLARMANRAEKLIIENERLDQLQGTGPPSYTYQQLEDVLYKGSLYSIEKDNCKYLLNRSIKQSQQYPEKYYFSRDAKVKYFVEFNGNHGLVLEMAKRIRNRNYLVVKATKSSFINERLTDLIGILRQNNPNFEFHEIEGTHHVHLNNPQAVARALSPFILRHRPVTLETWSVDDIENDVHSRKSKKTSKL